ncbi:MAG: carboxypeptidase-like regulatory domain-containing protein [Candidatus Thermoplasmatota archaeon]|jgi:hypothetical protein
MRKGMSWLSGISFLAVVLAGCSGTDGSPADDPLADGAAELELEATASTGVIRGIVVTEAIQPIEGATVTLKGAQTGETKTNEGGAFGFDDLAPGTYFLIIHKLGHTDSQQSAEVVAGVADPAIIKVLLVANLGELPSYDMFHFAGFLECNVVVVIVFFPCAIPFVGPVGNDNFDEAYNLTGNVSWIHTSLVWEPTQPVGTELYMNVGTPETEIVGYAGGPSPITVDVSGGDLEEFQGNAVVIEVSGNGEQGIAGAELQQSFDAYIVVFHNFLPPEGYAYHSDGDPVLPQ